MPKPSLLLDNNAEVVVLQRIFDGSRDAIAILAPDGRYLHQNPSHRELLGYSDQEIVRSTAAVHLGEQNARAIRHAVAESGQFTGEITSQTRDGDEKLLDVTVFPVHDDDGQVICAVAVGRDVTEVRMNQRRLDTVLRGTSGLIGEEYFRAMTEQVARVLGVRSATVGAFIAEEEAELMAVWLDGEHRNSGMVLPCNGLPCHHVKETGEPLMLRSLDGFDVDLPWPVGAYIALPVRDETREVIGFLSIMNDESVQHQELAVSLMKLYVERAGAEMRRMRDDESMRRLTRELEQANAELQTLVNHDPITRLLNRNGLGQVLSTELRRARNGSDLQAILVDCDDFSEVNEQLGFAVGDIVLREIGKRLREASRDCDVVARVGGDEFVIILPDTSLARAGRVAERLRLAVASTPVIITQDVVKVTVSMGVATVPSNASTLEEILTLAYGSLHSSKQDGKNRVSSNDWPAAAPAQDADGCFNRSPSSPRLTEIGEQLLVGKGIRAVKQSIVDLDTEREVGWEMLCRGPNGPFESPAHFFRVSLEQNILTSVDLHCLQACVAAAKQLDGSHRIHVNLYPSTMLATPTSRLIEMFANGPHRFVLELSEQQFLGDTSLLRPHVMALRKAGIKVAVDDVGFGRSSLEALLHLEPDVVKIDRSCVSGVSNDPHKARLLSRLVRVVGALGAEMVAEGIEDRDDLVLLQSFEIDYGQGYLWGRPA